jgi:hypothetical protein
MREEHAVKDVAANRMIFDAFMAVKIHYVFSEDGGSQVLQNVGIQPQDHSPEDLDIRMLLGYIVCHVMICG